MERGAARTGTQPGSAAGAAQNVALSAELLGRMLVEFAGVEYVAIDAAGDIVHANERFAAHVGVRLMDLPGQPLARYLSAGDIDMVRDWAESNELPTGSCLVNFVTADQETYTLRCVVDRGPDTLVLIGEAADSTTHSPAEDLLRVNNEFATLTRQLARKSRELERTHAELEKSYWHLRKIQEVMPVCMSCGQVKGDGLRWQSVVDYLSSNQIFLSHGYCPPCAEAAFREAGIDSE